MKLAEALITRADLQKRIAQLQTRANENSQVQDGDQPTQDPMAIIAQINDTLTQLEALIVQINITNLRVNLPDGRSMTAALARRDNLQMRWSALSQVVNSANESSSRYSLSEIKMVKTVNVAALQAQMDQLAVQRRELDMQIQATNWSAELV